MKMSIPSEAIRFVAKPYGVSNSRRIAEAAARIVDFLRCSSSRRVRRTYASMTATNGTEGQPRLVTGTRCTSGAPAAFSLSQ
jgi:hypothetical protein